MKKAIEWFLESSTFSGCNREMAVGVIDAIQRDASKSAFEKAAEIINDARGNGESDLRSIRDQIKSEGDAV